MYCVGLTGTIASGKSTVAKIFAELGAEIINTDDISREITKANSPVLHEITNKFGNGILDKNGNLNRKKLRSIIFNNKDDKLFLENLLHPLIRKEIQNKINHSSARYCIIEIPLLIKKESFPYLNYILLITSEKAEQLLRLKNRDASSKENSLKILNSQPSLENYLKVADEIIPNNSSIEDLRLNVIKLHD